ncbi:unnamed protein product [Mycena citricolor]|uniref:Uncharacterized protein n=1 Tax=Mycena citricolor TaxID=2018698 RepID=A0AAD2Q2H9_9AGAR|nr:unnamed protein product [Mycena citricolor]
MGYIITYDALCTPPIAHDSSLDLDLLLSLPLPSSQQLSIHQSTAAMGRWSQYDEDSYRLPCGMVRTGYDADTGRYIFQDRSGTFYGLPGSEYGPVDAGYHGRSSSLPGRALFAHEARGNAQMPPNPQPRKSEARVALPRLSIPNALRTLRRSITRRCRRRPLPLDASSSSSDSDAESESSAALSPVSAPPCRLAFRPARTGPARACVSASSPNGRPTTMSSKQAPEPSSSWTSQSPWGWDHTTCASASIYLGSHSAHSADQSLAIFTQRDDWARPRASSRIHAPRPIHWEALPVSHHNRLSASVSSSLSGSGSGAPAQAEASSARGRRAMSEDGGHASFPVARSHPAGDKMYYSSARPCARRASLPQSSTTVLM